MALASRYIGGLGLERCGRVSMISLARVSAAEGGRMEMITSQVEISSIRETFCKPEDSERARVVGERAEREVSRVREG